MSNTDSEPHGVDDDDDMISFSISQRSVGSEASQNNNNNQQQQQQQQEEPSQNGESESLAEHNHETLFPRVRDHSYLPAMHPLYTPDHVLHTASDAGESSHSQWLPSATRRVKRNQLQELIVLELPGLVVFPHDRLPLRLLQQQSSASDTQTASLIRTIARQIDAARKFPGTTPSVRLGILAPEPIDRPTRDHDNNFNGDSVAAQEQQQQARRRLDRDRLARRESWTRRGMGPERLRRISQRLQEELGTLESDNDMETATATTMSNNNTNAESRPEVRSLESSTATSSSLTSNSSMHEIRLESSEENANDMERTNDSNDTRSQEENANDVERTNDSNDTRSQNSNNSTSHSNRDNLLILSSHDDSVVANQPSTPVSAFPVEADDTSSPPVRSARDPHDTSLIRDIAREPLLQGVDENLSEWLSARRASSNYRGTETTIPTRRRLGGAWILDRLWTSTASTNTSSSSTTTVTGSRGRHQGSRRDGRLRWSLENPTREAAIENRIRSLNMLVGLYGGDAIMGGGAGGGLGGFNEASISPRDSRTPPSWKGRIGTIVTVVYTHGDGAAARPGSLAFTSNQSGVGDVWQSYEQQGELVLTAVGTSRFRIVSCVDAENQGNYRNSPYSYYARSNTMGSYWVEELEDEPVVAPPPLMFPATAPAPHYVPAEPFSRAMKRQRRVLHSLADRTPLPEFVYRKFWPWRLVALVRQALKRTPTFSGVLESLLTLENETCNSPPVHESNIDGSSDTSISCQTPTKLTQSSTCMEPTQFAYWMASNLPLGQDEKMDILELDTTVERLQYILNKILEVETSESIIHCKRCGIPLAKANSLFTVGGAEGTSGNYVNMYGHIHQTITLRAIDEDEVRFQGRPETRDSWFPGYSWRIMNCGCCVGHLGWRFVSVCGRESSSKDRPLQFYGLCAANVATFVPDGEESRRRHHNHRHRHRHRARDTMSLSSTSSASSASS